MLKIWDIQEFNLASAKQLLQQQFCIVEFQIFGKMNY